MLSHGEDAKTLSGIRASDGRGEIALADEQTGYPDWCGAPLAWRIFFVVNLAKDLK